MATGTPIRLVQENGDLIELDAQSMVMTTSRKVGGSALPLTGSRRIGLDMNVNSAMINVQGIIADDREESGATSATALSTSVEALALGSETHGPLMRTGTTCSTRKP